MFVTKDIKYRTFNLENWARESSKESLQNVAHELIDLVNENNLRVWIKVYDMWDFKSAFDELLFPKQRKLVFSLHNDGVRN